MSQGIRLQRIAPGQPTVASTTVTQPPEAATPCAQQGPSHRLPAVHCLNTPCARAAENIRKTISGCWSRLEELGKAIQQNLILKASVKIRTYSLESWPKLKNGLSIIKQRFTLSVWLTLIISLVVGGVGLRYTDMSTQLALWTATKDFYEHCQSQNVSFCTMYPISELLLNRSDRYPHLLGTATVKKPYRTQLDDRPTSRLDL